MYDTIIRNVRAVLPNSGVTPCSIAISGGKIAKILPAEMNAQSTEVVDATGLIALPGAIDAHLHLGHGNSIARPMVPADSDKETAAAAKGGITCFIPYLLDTGDYGEIVTEVLDVTSAGARIDYGYHFIISTEAQLSAVPRYIADHGVVSFKLFMNNRGGEGSRLGLPDIDDGFLFRLAESAAQYGGLVAPHPENIEVAWVLRDRLKAQDPEGKGGLRTWDDSRPDFIEAEAVQRVAYLAHQVGAPVHAVHISSAKALEAGLLQRSAGASLTMETCPHYLTHDIDWEGGDVGKINPPVRRRENCERLWQALADGEIDTVGTDHVHRPKSAKQGGIWSASPGCPGMETMLPVLLSEGYHRRGLPLERIAELTAENPARIMGLSHRKGSIAEGMDADLALVNLDKEWVVSDADVVSSAGYSIYEGWTFKGAIIHTLVRGSFAVREGALVDAALGTGQYIKRRLRTPI